MKRNRKLIFETVFSAVILATPYLSHGAYTETIVTGGGSIKGKVFYRGALPEDAKEKIAIAKNMEVCGGNDREIIRVDVKKNVLRGVFVFIDSIREGKKWPPPEEGKYILTQKNCRFIPEYQVVRRGPLTIRNSDRGVLHNVNVREIIGVGGVRHVKRTLFNFAQPQTGEIEKELKPRRSPFIEITCEAHNFMFAYMIAPEHPYAVLVNDDGSFVLDDVPPGDYVVKAWHPTLGIREAKVTVPAEGAAKVNFEFSKKEE